VVTTTLMENPPQGKRWLAAMVMLTLSGCAYIPHDQSLVNGCYHGTAGARRPPVANGSIFQTRAADELWLSAAV
jgi:flagellar L-ring protein FlgH